VDIDAGLEESSMIYNIVLGLIALLCLLLDYMERNGKFDGTILSIKKNKIGDVHGNNNEINQSNV